jgi:hypothetical protein
MLLATCDDSLIMHPRSRPSAVSGTKGVTLQSRDAPAGTLGVAMHKSASDQIEGKDLMQGTVARDLHRPGLNRGSRFVSDAGDITDPIEGVEKSVSRSKDVIASATEELNQHQRWLKSYLASEKRDRDKHARWLKRQQVMHRRQLQRQRMIRSCKRFALAFVFFVRSVYLVLLKGATSALIYLRDRLLISASWIGLKAHALALALIRAEIGRAHV